MTVSTSTNKVFHNGNSAATIFAYPYRILSSAHLEVYVSTDGSTYALQTEGGAGTYDYTVTGVGDLSGGSVTFNNPPPTVTQGVLLLRNVPLTQISDYVNGDEFPMDVLEDDLDKAMMCIQQLNEEGTRSLQLPITSTFTNQVPEPVVSKALFTKADGTGFEWLNVFDLGATAVSAFMATLLDDVTAADARSTLGVDGLGSAYRNRIINGAMLVAQRGTSATVTAGTAVPTASAGYPCVDRWFVYSTGANVTAAQVGSGLATNRLQITGAASVTAVGVGQRIEQANSADLAGQTVTLSVDLANSLLTTVTWTVSYANTANAFGTIGTPTKTQIATGTFTVDANPTRYSAQIAIPAAATTGIEILFTVGAQVSGTWQIGNVQLERGETAGTFDPRPYGHELALCQRYLPAFLPTGSTSMVGVGQCVAVTAARVQFNYPVTPRVAPTGITATTAANFSVTNAGGNVACTSLAASILGLRVGRVEFNVAAGLTAGQACEGLASSTSSILFTGCEVP